MYSLIDAAFSRTRTALLALLFIVLAGLSAYLAIPKEAEPDVAIPLIYVSMTYEGISPEDAERLLIRPMEKELQSIEGIEEMTATAGEGYASVMLEFDAGFDADLALQDVREKVDIAKTKLPAGTDEPSVNEINVALFPVLTVILSGPVPERTLVNLAKNLQDRTEALPGVLEVDIGGDREELMEIIVDPLIMETYNIAYDELFNMIQRNNRLVAAGAVDTGAGRIVLKVPGVIENIEDVLSLPVKVEGGTVITFEDVAAIRRTFKDPEGFARLDGQPAVALEVSKRIGANIIETIEQIRAIVAEEQKQWPASVRVNYIQDKSEEIRTMLGDLQNNVISAVVLVMIVIVAALGPRSAVLVGLAIPGSFLAGILVIYALGYTLNIVALFSLILVVGMLVDGAIVVTELADRKMAEGLERKAAYNFAAKRMAWPITTSTATTLMVFVPLLFWPGVVGEFMKYLPITVIACLSASLLMALIFVPVLGSLVGRGGAVHEHHLQALVAAERGDLRTIQGFTGAYLRLLEWLLMHPGKVLLAAIALLIGTYMAYGAFGRGVEFFPEVEPEFSQIQVRARGDLSIWEKDALVRKVEGRILDMPEFESTYSRTLNRPSSTLAEDVIGVIQLEFIDWQQRRPATRILEEVRERTQDIPGVILEVRKQESGPTSGKPIQLELSARNPRLLEPAVAEIRDLLRQVEGLVDVEDSRPLPGIEWRLRVDRERAARYGADITLLGNAVQMVTTGIKVADYRPDDADEEVDIRIRFPFSFRNLDQLDQLRVPTPNGLIPITNFVTFEPAPKIGTLKRTDAERVMTISADVVEGLLVDDKVREIRGLLAGASLHPDIQVHFKGQDKDQRETMDFLSKAFVTAVFLMAIILVTQFNSIYQALLVLSAIVFSTAGVLLGLLITVQPFGIVMGGIGVIALAGIVVNNNIVLIDTFNDLRSHGLNPVEAALRTGAQRLRPVLLTSITTILGLMPMVLAINIDLINRDMTFGAPSTQWWIQLSSAIAGGLAFATLLTLILTPCLLTLGHHMVAWWAARRNLTHSAENTA